MWYKEEKAVKRKGAKGLANGLEIAGSATLWIEGSFDKYTPYATSQCFVHCRLKEIRLPEMLGDVLMRHWLEQASCKHISGHWKFSQLKVRQELVLRENNLEGGIVTLRCACGNHKYLQTDQRERETMVF